MNQLLKKIIRRVAFRTNRAHGIFTKFCRPDGEEYARFLKARNVFYGIGENCSVQTNVTITDPQYVRLGDNVRLSGCTLFGHDGSVNVFNQAFGWKVDRVGKIDIRDNVFIGHGAIILPNVTIGPNAVVAAGSLVSRDVPENTVVGGIPARKIAIFDELAAKMRRECREYPWIDLIERRETAFDAEMQPALDRLRLAHFWQEANG